MSNNVSLQELLKAVDRATRPLNALQNASLTLASDIRDAQTALGASDNAPLTRADDPSVASRIFPVIDICAGI